MARAGFYPGSFDPVTNGHIDVISRCAKLVDDLVLGVGVHHGKKGFLEETQRVQLLKTVCEPIVESTGMKIRVVTFDNLAVTAAKEQGASVIIRGLRDATDFDYEVQMGQMNGAMMPEIETVFLAASPPTRMIASSLVKQIAKMGGDISSFVPAEALKVINAALDS
jgi:pantetheine-phosphate adenylyltransferase